jgi:hypothetical protein
MKKSTFDLLSPISEKHLDIPYKITMINPNERRRNMKLTKTILGVLVMVVAAFAFQDASITSEVQPLSPSILSSGFEGSDFTTPLDIIPDVRR